MTDVQKPQQSQPKYEPSCCRSDKQIHALPAHLPQGTPFRLKGRKCLEVYVDLWLRGGDILRQGSAARSRTMTPRALDRKTLGQHRMGRGAVR